MRKYIKFGIIGFVVLLFAGGVFYIYNHLSEIFLPKISLSILQFNKLNEGTTKLDIQVVLKNKFPFSMKTEGLKFEVLADDSIIAETVNTTSFRIRALRKNTFIIPINLDAKAIRKSGKNLGLNHKDSTLYRFRLLLLNKRNWILPDTIEIAKEELMPTFKFPQVKLVDVKATNLLSKKKRKVLISLGVTNFNAAPMKINNPKYSVSIDNESNVLFGQLSGQVVVEPRSQKTFVLPVEVDVSYLLMNSRKLLSKKEDHIVKITLDGEFDTENEMIDGCKFRTVILGDFGTFFKPK